MEYLLVIFALACSATTQAQICTPLNAVYPGEWIDQGTDVNVLRFPAGLNVSVPGVTDRNCDHRIPFLNQKRDPDFCLTHNKEVYTNGQYQLLSELFCKRCPPELINSYKYEIWKHINTMNKEYADKKQTSPTTGLPAFPFKFCLTCYARAKEINEAQQDRTPLPGEAMYIGVNYRIPRVPNPTDRPEDWQVVEGTDVRKPNITITTRVACGKQLRLRLRNGQEISSFRIPQPEAMAQFDAEMKGITKGFVDQFYGEGHACHAPGAACSKNQFEAERRLGPQLANVSGRMGEYIEEFMKTVEFTNALTGQTDHKAVNGHHEDLMEIPVGWAAVVRSQVDLNVPKVGFAEGIPDGGYIDLATGGPMTGCQAMEYGMVALSPGNVETACWLTPIITDSAGYVDTAEMDRWRENELAKAREVAATARAEADKAISQLVRYCRDLKPKFAENGNMLMYEHATRVCETRYCMPQKPLPPGVQSVAYDSICDQVEADAANFKAQAMRLKQGGGGFKRGGRGGFKQGGGRFKMGGGGGRFKQGGHHGGHFHQGK